MAATDLNELKLNWMKNWYQHWKEHVYFSNLAKFQHIRCYISLGNVRWNSTNLDTFVWLGVYVIPPFHFSTYIFSADIKPDTLKLCKVTKVNVLFLVLVYVFNFNLFEFSAAILEKGLLVWELGQVFTVDMWCLVEEEWTFVMQGTQVTMGSIIWMEGKNEGTKQYKQIMCIRKKIPK